MDNLLRMLSRIIKGRSLVDSMMEDFSRMMGHVSRMFRAVTREVFEGKRARRIGTVIYREDIFVNKGEREIRKLVAEHLAFEPKADVGSSLVLMSVVKDVERIGDYCKNIHEVGLMFRSFTPKHRYFKTFKGMSDEIEGMIVATEKTFRHSLEEEAKGILNQAHRIGGECDTLLAEFAGSRMPANDAVCLSLLSRHFKRIASHLSNIASAVILPVHKIDFALHRERSKKELWLAKALEKAMPKRRKK